MDDVKVYLDFASSNNSTEADYFREKIGEETFLFHTRSKKISSQNFFKSKGAFSLKCNIQGREYYNFPDRLLSTSEEKFLLTNPCSKYESFIESATEVESLFIFFSEDKVIDAYNSLMRKNANLLDYPIPFKKDFSFYEKLYDMNAKYLSYIKAILNKVDFHRDYSFELSELVHQLLTELIIDTFLIRKEISNIQAIKKSTREELYSRLNKAKDYMDSCYEEKISIRDLALISCMCEHHFVRKFKSVFKISPYQYLSKIRIERSKQLLQKKNLLITEISDRVGFDNVVSFNRSFKKHMGCSPTKYRLG